MRESILCAVLFSLIYFIFIRCDLNGINNSTVWQSKYFNHARKQGKQVAINDRCGNGISDFMTSEYQNLYNTPSRYIIIIIITIMILMMMNIHFYFYFYFYLYDINI